MIAVHNDGKGKAQSFEASIADKDEFGNSVVLDGALTGYGRNAEDAVEDLKKKVNEHLLAYAARIQAIDYGQTFAADWQGKPLSILV